MRKSSIFSNYGSDFLLEGKMDFKIDFCLNFTHPQLISEHLIYWWISINYNDMGILYCNVLIILFEWFSQDMLNWRTRCISNAPILQCEDWSIQKMWLGWMGVKCPSPAVLQSGLTFSSISPRSTCAWTSAVLGSHVMKCV